MKNGITCHQFIEKREALNSHSCTHPRKTLGQTGLWLAHVAFTFPGLPGLTSLLKSRAHPKFLHVGLLFSEKCPPSQVVLLRPLSFGFLLEIYKIFKASKSYTSNECLVWHLIIYNTTGNPYLLSGHISSILT